MNLNRLLKVLAVSYAAGTIGICSANSVEGKTVAFIPKIVGNEFFDSAAEISQKYARDWGFEVLYMGSRIADVKEESKIVSQAIDKGVDAICISSVDPEGLNDALKKASDAGITVVTWDSDVNSKYRTIMVSQGTPEELGHMLVDLAVDSLEKRGVDPNKKEVKYAWHYSQNNVADQNSWQKAGEKYIKETYPNWINVAPKNYYSEQDLEKAVQVGNQILMQHPDIDVIICNDSTALPGQLEALREKGLDKHDVTVTGFASPNPIKQYVKDDIVEQWGLWDCGFQGAIASYIAAYIDSGHSLGVGNKIIIPDIGTFKVMPNDCLVKGAATEKINNGVVLLYERLIFTKDNVDNYNF